MSTYRHRPAAILSIVLQLAVGFAFTADLVVCTEASGHVAIESAFGADCCDEPTLPEGLRSFLDPEDCGCVDRPLIESPVELRSRVEHVMPSPRTVLVPAAPSAAIAGAVSILGAPARPSPPSEHGPAARRSIVLVV